MLMAFRPAIPMVSHSGAIVANDNATAVGIHLHSELAILGGDRAREASRFRLGIYMVVQPRTRKIRARPTAQRAGKHSMCKAVAVASNLVAYRTP